MNVFSSLVFFSSLIKSIHVQVLNLRMFRFLSEINSLIYQMRRFRRRERFVRIRSRLLEPILSKIRFFRLICIWSTDLLCSFLIQWILYCFLFWTDWSSWSRYRFFRLSIFYSFYFYSQMSWFHERNESKTWSFYDFFTELFYSVELLELWFFDLRLL
jgi:hypothetical protein